ncbi:MAG: hypothetical protein F6K28_00545 [Microcoleus sp. SIO2G3]|nr:hypothetical protein [Microcoleus sp. SIO2G3]
MNTHYTVHQTNRFWLNVQECLGLTLPPQDMKRVMRLRRAVRPYQAQYIQICHSLEVLGSGLDDVNDVRDVNGVSGGSPGATVAMLNCLRTP